MTLGWKCFKQQESPIESYTSGGGFTPAWILSSPRKSSWSISVPHVVCSDERSIDATGCSQGLGRCLLQKPAAMDSQHDPRTVYGIFLRAGFPSRFCRIFGSWASYHGPNHQSTITLEAKPTIKIINSPPELLMKQIPAKIIWSFPIVDHWFHGWLKAPRKLVENQSFSLEVQRQLINYNQQFQGTIFKMVFDFQGFLPKSSEAQQKLKHTKRLLGFASFWPSKVTTNSSTQLGFETKTSLQDKRVTLISRKPPTVGLQKPEVPDTVEKSRRLPVEVGSWSCYLWGILSILGFPRYPWDLFNTPVGAL